MLEVLSATARRRLRVSGHAHISIEAAECVSCKLGECADPEHETFRCAACGLLWPWSCGAADDGPDLCDWCWCAVREWQSVITE